MIDEFQVLDGWIEIFEFLEPSGFSWYKIRKYRKEMLEAGVVFKIREKKETDRKAVLRVKSFPYLLIPWISKKSSKGEIL